MATLACAAAVIAACAAPTRPSEAGSAPNALDPASVPANITPDDLQARGWTCIVPPTPNRVACSHPNQGFPVFATPPPEDRPPSYQIFLFDGAGTFLGVEILIRTDLYANQICESTRQLYMLRPPIGYYACLKTVGR